MSTLRFKALAELPFRNYRKDNAVEVPKKLSELFCENVFSEETMRAYLTKEAFTSIQDAIKKGSKTPRNIADQIALGTPAAHRARLGEARRVHQPEHAALGQGPHPGRELLVPPGGDQPADQRSVHADELEIATHRAFQPTGDRFRRPALHRFRHQLHDLAAVT